MKWRLSHIYFKLPLGSIIFNLNASFCIIFIHCELTQVDDNIPFKTKLLYRSVKTSPIKYLMVIIRKWIFQQRFRLLRVYQQWIFFLHFHARVDTGNAISLHENKSQSKHYFHWGAVLSGVKLWVFPVKAITIESEWGLLVVLSGGK